MIFVIFYFFRIPKRWPDRARQGESKYTLGVIGGERVPELRPSTSRIITTQSSRIYKYPSKSKYHFYYTILMKLRVLGTLLGRRDDAQYHRASREEARFREAEWDNYLRHGPRGRAEYHHGSEHCI